MRILVGSGVEDKCSGNGMRTGRSNAEMGRGRGEMFECSVGMVIRVVPVSLSAIIYIIRECLHICLVA